MPRKKKSFNEAMLGAIDAVNKDGTGVNAAAAQFGVPPSTLRDWLSGWVVHGTHPGPAPYLEETQLVEYLTYTSKVGYGQTRKQVMNNVKRVTQDKGVLKKDKTVVAGFRDSGSEI